MFRAVPFRTFNRRKNIFGMTYKNSQFDIFYFNNVSSIKYNDTVHYIYVCNEWAGKNMEGKKEKRKRENNMNYDYNEISRELYLKK